MAEAPLPAAAINGKGRTARGERAARPAGRGFRVWDSNFNVSFEAVKNVAEESISEEYKEELDALLKNKTYRMRIVIACAAAGLSGALPSVEQLEEPQEVLDSYH